MLVDSAERLEVQKDQAVASYGEVGNRFFIIREGSFEVHVRGLGGFLGPFWGVTPRFWEVLGPCWSSFQAG